MVEFNSGVVFGVKNILLQELQYYIGKLKQIGKLVVVYCCFGNCSGMVVQILNEKGIEVYNVGSVG